MARSTRLEITGANTTAQFHGQWLSPQLQREDLGERQDI
jgi:hypothetical protein